MNRLRDWTVTGQPQQNVTYDTIGAGTASLGNIKHKDGVGDYTYPAAGSAHPHAVLTAGASGTATYDNNGNMTSGFGRSITWTWFNQPQLITGSLGSAYFEYDDNHQRVWQHATGSNGTVDTTYIGGFYEKVDDGGNTIKHKCYINSPSGRVAIYTQTYDLHTFGTTYDTKYCHRDHLGSVDVITDSTGAVLERDSFDAWGARRATDWQGPVAPGYQSIVSRGFTDHEQMDTLGLVNMNGRIYDPGIGRFLSADPYIQAPTVTQNFNRYSYVVNNPLSLSDPSGFNIFGNFFKWLNNTFGSTGAQIVVAVAAIAVGVVTAGFATSAAAAFWGSAAIFTEAGTLTLTGSIVAGAGFGFGAGFSGTLLAGGSIGAAFQAGLIGGVIGGISGGIAFELGGLNPGGDFLSLGHLEQTAGHAVLGGAVAEVQGDSFQSGALAAGLSALFGPAINKFDWEAQRVAASAVVGGTAAELGGGKFANGAITAAFLRLYNEESARLDLKADWKAGKFAAWLSGRRLTLTAMNHADGTISGDWNLTPDEIELVRSNPGYQQVLNRLRAALTAQYSNAPDGVYQFNVRTFSSYVFGGKLDDARWAIGSARFTVWGTVIIRDGQATFSARVWMHDYFDFGSVKANVGTPSWEAKQLQQAGYLRPFWTSAYYNETVSVWVR